MCDNKFRNQVDAIAPYGLTAGRVVVWPLAGGACLRRTYLASWTAAGSLESSR